MNTWHASPSSDWTTGDSLIAGHGGGIGEFGASYAVDLRTDPMLNGRIAADVRLTSPHGTGAGLVCRADTDWTFLTFHTAPEGPDDAATVARIGIFREGALTPVAALAEPVELSRGYNRFSLEFFSGQVRGEIRAGDRTYELHANCPHLPFPGRVGVVKFYGTGVLIKSVTAERTEMPFAVPQQERAGGEFEYDVFLCHSHDDAEEVHRIAERLADNKIRYWLDRDRIDYGDAVTKKIEDGLQASRYVLPCVSGNLIRSGWARAEYGGILNTVFSGASRRKVIPLMLEQVAADQENIPILLRDLRRVSSFNKVEFAAFIDFLVSR
ncbi:toll/interleukin-1 receptor domain-containing protein [Streptomyces sp. ISL-11]|uniref:toll/interleukin-1 receptor domain-containing protein n=1 Tax=Streptomyces sp. ISL-11 TaxID=2819174 RepID=UPI001BECC828|nr:toll/interleukin-1 receptor domain-containing protein [Streptomyces sp. ISL-11]MBT2384610.1 toll/interleukin-1 receptor domain-containing protein [Streptomyces sp. ISL-11]